MHELNTGGLRGPAGLIEADQIAELEKLKTAIIDQNFNSETYAYPYGHWTPTFKNLVGRDFSTARLAGGSTEFGPTMRPADPLAIRAIDGTTTAKSTITALLTAASTSHGVVPLMYHDFAASASGSTTAVIQDFRDVVAHARGLGMRFMTMGEYGALLRR